MNNEFTTLQVTITSEAKEKLDQYKKKHNHKSNHSAINELIIKHC